jgi:hypothetical protein
MVILGWLVIVDSGLSISGRSIAPPASNRQSHTTNHQRLDNHRSGNQQ